MNPEVVHPWRKMTTRRSPKKKRWKEPSIISSLCPAFPQACLLFQGLSPERKCSCPWGREQKGSLRSAPRCHSSCQPSGRTRWGPEFSVSMCCTNMRSRTQICLHHWMATCLGASLPLPDPRLLEAQRFSGWCWGFHEVMHADRKPSVMVSHYYYCLKCLHASPEGLCTKAFWFPCISSHSALHVSL